MKDQNTSADDATAPEDIEVFDEDGALSRGFLLHRGYCCKNGCRNCPYGFHDKLNQSESEGDSTSS